MPMRKRLALASLGLMLLPWIPTANGSPSPNPSSGNPDRGMLLFSSYCASCHGEGGRGDGPVAPRLMRDFNVKPVDFTLGAWQSSRSDGELRKVLQGGGKAVHRSMFMPAWGATLNDQQQKDLVAYMRELGNPATRRHTPASMISLQQQVELGRTLYMLHCLACHGPRGAGDGPRLVQAREDGLNIDAPDFSRPGYARHKTDDELREFAESGIYHGKLSLDPQQHRWWHGPLSEEESSALVLYLRCLSIR